MTESIITHLAVANAPNAIWVDGTLGAGGHSAAILSMRSDSRLLGFDLDPKALELASERLAPFKNRADLIHASYEALPHALAERSISAIDGMLLDFGLSSMQLDTPQRGFAFRHEAPLDMRFDPTANIPTAADLINTMPQEALANLIYRYGEEPASRIIAQAIIQNRPIHTTTQLADLIKASINPRKRRKQAIHPATQTFQALRIAVNDELGAVERILPLAIQALKHGGRLATLTFHSLEDRLVKQAFKLAASDCICPPKQPICTCEHKASIHLVSRKPLTASDEEVKDNPRARSAKLRVIEKL